MGEDVYTHPIPCPLCRISGPEVQFYSAVIMPGLLSFFFKVCEGSSGSEDIDSYAVGFHVSFKVSVRN